MKTRSVTRTSFSLLSAVATYGGIFFCVNISPYALNLIRSPSFCFCFCNFWTVLLCHYQQSNAWQTKGKFAQDAWTK